MTTRAAANGPVTEFVDTINGGIAGFQGSVGGVGGMTALHHAVRQGNIDAAVALVEGGANINDTTVVDHSTPLVMAAINGQFDVMMKLIEHGANPNIATTTGMTPLYATLNTQWLPKSRYPQPQDVQIQKTSYLDVVKALLKAGANPNARLTQQPWYFAFNNCGNANCGLENIEGTTAFWRAAYALDVDAMRVLAANGADVTLPSVRTPVPAGRGGRGGRGGGGGGGRAAAAGGGGAVVDVPVRRSTRRPTRPRRPYRRASASIRSMPPPALATATALPATHTATRRTAGCRRCAIWSRSCTPTSTRAT